MVKSRQPQVSKHLAQQAEAVVMDGKFGLTTAKPIWPSKVEM